MLAIAKTLGVQLVHLFGARRAYGKPSVIGDDFESADRFPVSRCGRQDGADRFARQLLRVDLGGRELQEEPLLIGRRRCVDPLVDWRPEFAGQVGVARAGIDAQRCRDLSREQAENDAVLVRRPRRPVNAQERGTCAFLTAETDRSVEELPGPSAFACLPQVARR